MGTLTGIARRDRKRAPMETLERADVSKETGVAEDFRGRRGKRQVTVISARSWREACRDLGQELPWTTRRANLLVEGLDLPDTTGEDPLAAYGETIATLTHRPPATPRSAAASCTRSTSAAASSPSCA